MDDSGLENFDQLDGELVSDDQIKSLLLSRDSNAEQMGLLFLDWKMREWVLGQVRIWSNEKNWRLESADLDEIYKATIDSIKKNVDKRNFQESGELRAYVLKIAGRRAVDFLRRRTRRARGYFDEDRAVAEFLIDPDRYQGMEQAKDLIRKRFETALSDKEKLVYTHVLQLYEMSDFKVWPKSKTVMESVNDDGVYSLTLGAVQGARNRARRKLRGWDLGKGEQK